MDLLQTLEVTQERTLLILPTPHTQMFHQRFLQKQLQHPNSLQQTDWKHYSKYRGLTHSVKSISKHLLNGKAPQHETDIFTHVKELLYKHIMDSGKQFLALGILKSSKYTVLVEAHDKLGHQGNSCTYCLIKRQYYGKGMNKDIRKYIVNCVLAKERKPKFNITLYRWWKYWIVHSIKLLLTLSWNVIHQHQGINTFWL